MKIYIRIVRFRKSVNILIRIVYFIGMNYKCRYRVFDVVRLTFDFIAKTLFIKTEIYA